MNIKKLIIPLLMTSTLCTSTILHAENGHDHKGETHEEEGGVELNQEQLKSAGILVETLTPHALPIEIEALGEIRLNRYQTSQVTPRIDAQIIKRLARLGEHVTKGQPLVILSSVDMAKAQGELLVTANEWQRVKKLGKKVVSQRRYLEARIAYQQAQAKVVAYGMTKQQMNQLLKTNSVSQANGNFTLYSSQDGTVIQDDFILGQLSRPGDIIFEITNESELWIEAKVNPKQINQLEVGASAQIKIDQQWIKGTVIQIHHALDEITRTLSVRIAVKNPNDELHPGQFVTANIQTGTTDQEVFSVPIHAVLRSPDGDWQVYIEQEKGHFEGKEITIVRKIPGRIVIDGLEAGTRVVTQGAFFIQSEEAKSGFAVHNH